MHHLYLIRLVYLSYRMLLYFHILHFFRMHLNLIVGYMFLCEELSLFYILYFEKY